MDRDFCVSDEGLDRDGILSRHIDALALRVRSECSALPPPPFLLLLAVHCAGILAIARLTLQPAWLALIPLLLVQPVALSMRTRSLRLMPEALAPLLFAYLILVARLAVAFAHRAVGGYDGSASVPDPWGDLLNLNVAIGLTAIWALLAQTTALVGAFRRSLRVEEQIGRILLVLAVGWGAVTYVNLRSSGVTASDPYGYVQMAVDVAQTGSPIHVFKLGPEVDRWGLSTWPAVPVGYRPPEATTGSSASVWPPGYSTLLAGAYLLGGESGLYLLTPLVGLAVLLATWLLCLEPLGGWPASRRRLAAGLAALILATSYEQVVHAVVPMADLAAQLFGVLAVYFACRTSRSSSAGAAILAGLFLGLAFATRYTQLLVGLAVLVAWVPLLRRAAITVEPEGTAIPLVRLLPVLACAGVAALLAATPVLWYHVAAFGSPFAVGSSELGIFGWQHVPNSLASVGAEFLRPNEFLYILPFIALGAVRLWRTARWAAMVLLTWLLGLLAFHLPYEALRMRDLLPEYPAVAILAGAGIADLLGWVFATQSHRLRSRLLAAASASVMVLLWVRTVSTLQLAAPGDGFATFGYLNREQRASFAELVDLTPPGSVVAASLNSGAVSLYAGRDSVRPASWSPEEWESFVARALAGGRPVFLLDDGSEMASPLEIVRSRYRVSPVASLPLPYFVQGSVSEPRDVRLYGITP